MFFLLQVILGAGDTLGPVIQAPNQTSIDDNSSVPQTQKVCSGGTRWKELGHLRQVFKANGYPETNVNRNLRARPTPRISTQTSQTPPKLLPYIPGLSERIEKMCRPLGVKTVSRSRCTLRSSLVHVKQPREDKRKKGVI